MDIWKEEKENLEWGYKEKTKVVFKVRSKSSDKTQVGESECQLVMNFPITSPFFADFLLVS